MHAYLYVSVAGNLIPGVWMYGVWMSQVRVFEYLISDVWVSKYGCVYVPSIY
jgi:hypothetical protein